MATHYLGQHYLRQHYLRQQHEVRMLKTRRAKAYLVLEDTWVGPRAIDAQGTRLTEMGWLVSMMWRWVGGRDLHVCEGGQHGVDTDTADRVAVEHELPCMSVHMSARMSTRMEYTCVHTHLYTHACTHAYTDVYTHGLKTNVCAHGPLPSGCAEAAPARSPTCARACSSRCRRHNYIYMGP